MMSSAVLVSESVEFWELDEEDGDFASGMDYPLSAAAEPPASGGAGAERALSDESERLDWQRGEFDILADELAAAAAGVSSTRRLLSHPAYIGILALGEEAVPLLLERLRAGTHRPTWLTILGSLTALPPSAGAATIDEAASAWLKWQKHDMSLFSRLPASKRSV